MVKKVVAEALFFFLICCAVAAAWYDITCLPRTVSHMVDTAVRRDPIWAFVAGVSALALLIVISYLWSITFRFALAVLVLGMVLGHLFWPQ